HKHVHTHTHTHTQTEKHTHTHTHILPPLSLSSTLLASPCVLCRTCRGGTASVMWNRRLHPRLRPRPPRLRATELLLTFMVTMETGLIFFATRSAVGICTVLL